MDDFGKLAGRESEARLIARRQWFWLHLAVYLTVQVFLIIVWIARFDYIPLVHLPAVRLGDSGGGTCRVRLRGADPEQIMLEREGQERELRWMNWLLRAHTDGRAYTTLAYLLVSLPLGIVGFVVVVTGLSLGIGLLVTVAGIPVLVATMLFALAFASLSRRLAWSLLDAPMPNLAERRPGSEGVFWRRLLDLGSRPRTVACDWVRHPRPAARCRWVCDCGEHSLGDSGAVRLFASRVGRRVDRVRFVDCRHRRRGDALCSDERPVHTGWSSTAFLALELSWAEW